MIKQMVLLVGALVLVGPAKLQSAVPLFSNSPTGLLFGLASHSPSGRGHVINYGFVVGDADLRVLQLGLWDEGIPGFDFPLDVGLYELGGNLLSSVTLQPGNGSELIGEFRYEPIEPVVLTSNASYVLAAFYPDTSGDKYRRESLSKVLASGNVASEVALVRGGIDTSKTPVTDDRPTELVYIEPFEDLIRIGPNLRFETIPEPSTTGIGASVFVFGLLRRWRFPQRRAACSP